MIYYVACDEANAVKIGLCEGNLNCLYSRFSQIQTHCPLRLELTGVQEGEILDERALHARFAADRIHGEWFRLSENLRSHLHGIPKPPPDVKRVYRLRNREPRWAA